MLTFAQIVEMRTIFNFARTAAPAVNIPVQAPVPELRNAQLAAIYHGQRICGDFYDFLRVSPTRVLFALLDVAGRLDQNREIVFAAQETFRTAGKELLGKDNSNEAEAMIEICIRLNRTILKTSGSVCSSPAFAGCYNETLRTVCYFNAGHTPGLVRDRQGTIELPATSLPLGLFSHSTSDAPYVALAPGSVLLVVSRGITEARRKGEEFGLDRVKESLERDQRENAKEICTRLVAGVQEFMGRPPEHNDVTALALTQG